MDTIQLQTSSPSADLANDELTPTQKADKIVHKLQEAHELAQATMAEAQQEQERWANKHRKEAPQLRVGDKVWLKLGKQLSTGRPKKKLDYQNMKYTVTRVISPHVVEINIPRVNPRFHIDRLRLAADDPLPSQTIDDSQPEAIEVDGHEEYYVDDILKEMEVTKRRRRETWYLVKYSNYFQPTWQPRKDVEESAALDRWIEYSRPHRDSQGRLPGNFQRPHPSTGPGAGG